MSMSSTNWLLMMILAINVILCPLEFGDYDIDALYALKESFLDPDQVLKTWDHSSTDPCSWLNVTCNENQTNSIGSKSEDCSMAPELANVQQLQYLELHENNIEGSIPIELGKLENLLSLELYKNNILGTLPRSLENLKSLQILRLNDNMFISGPVPKALLRIHYPDLNLGNTSLSGTIGTSYTRFE